MTPDLREARQAALRGALAADGLEGLIVSHLPNVRYLTGFTGTAGVLLFLSDHAVLVTDFRYMTQATTEVGDAAQVEVVPTDVWGRVRRAVGGARGPGEIGFEAHEVTVHGAERFRAPEWGRPVRATTQLVERLRATKHPVEVRAIRAAAALAAEAFDQMISIIRPGVSEQEIAVALESALRSAGSEWHPFPTIVATGPHSALPHARTSARTVKKGDFVLLDFGAQVDGYCSDLTRTVVAGRADEKQRAVYDLVRNAQRAAVRGMRVGQSGTEADALARRPIAERGFGEAFGHSLGHGLGLEVHEAPRVSQSNPDPLPPDAVVTVEPGIYLPGWGGVRIEDDVHLSATGAVLLSDGQTELRELS